MARLRRLPSLSGLSARDERLDHAIEIVAFGDEEGVRFRTTLTGSRALAGGYPEDALDQTDADGVSMREALIAFGGDPERAAFLRARAVSPPSSRRISSRARARGGGPAAWRRHRDQWRDEARGRRRRRRRPCGRDADEPAP